MTLLFCEAVFAERQTLVVDKDMKLSGGQLRDQTIVIAADGITLDGNDTTLVGPGVANDPKSFQGTAIVLQGCRGVTLKNIKAKGFAVALSMSDCDDCRVEECDFSGNYHDPKHGWGDGRREGGLILSNVRRCQFRKNVARDNWNGCDLYRCNENHFLNNDFSHCSNVCLKLVESRGNQVSENDLSYGIRIDRAAGEVHARDSTSVLIESGSDRNTFYRNDIRHGGDGIFIRSLNNWVSRFNVFIENDCSYANNNCVESWSPDNTWIRNTCNHGSYGFWLGGSDHSVLIGNEAAYNGLPDGLHNAPEPEFRHAGITIVGGSSTHTLIANNHVHHNGGAGIAFRGDVATKGKAWRAEHWVIRQNKIEHQRIGIYGRWGHNIDLCGNEFDGNETAIDIKETTSLHQDDKQSVARRAPRAILVGPERAVVGQEIRFDAADSIFHGGTGTFVWDIAGEKQPNAVAAKTFEKPGLCRVALTVRVDGLSDLAFRDVLVTQPVERELGTEDEPGRWSFAFSDDPQRKGRLVFENDADAVVGKSSLRIRARGYTGFDATAIHTIDPAKPWRVARAKTLSFWLRTINPDPTGWQDAGPVVELATKTGKATYSPGPEKNPRNPLREMPQSESRWLWSRLEIPLAGDQHWLRKDEGKPDLDQVESVRFTVDSWGAPGFTLWLDGLAAE